jgi:hypothetical protein
MAMATGETIYAPCKAVSYYHKFADFTLKAESSYSSASGKLSFDTRRIYLQYGLTALASFGFSK